MSTIIIFFDFDCALYLSLKKKVNYHMYFGSFKGLQMYLVFKVKVIKTLLY